MAITREKKEAIIDKVGGLLGSARLTVVARYSGLTVADMQTLRREASATSVSMTVAKNRLVKRALESHPAYRDVDMSLLTGQVMLALGEDEVAPAQVVANFGKTHPALEIVGGMTAEGIVLSADEVRALANLPSKDALRAQLVGTIAAPLSGLVGVLGGNVRGLVNVLSARASAIK